jgi:hypothetical protein
MMGKCMKEAGRRQHEEGPIIIIMLNSHLDMMHLKAGETSPLPYWAASMGMV